MTDMVASLLIVEDEVSLQELLRYNFETRKFRVWIAREGEEALSFLKREIPDLILLDWMLPGAMNGLEICRFLRGNPDTNHIPILILTARGQESQKIQGFAAGADDYVVKPFSVLELVARVEALLRRSHPKSLNAQISFGELSLDRSQKNVCYKGQNIPLSLTEFRLLERLLQNPKQVFTRSQLLDVIWGWETDVDERTVDTHIARLRKALCKNGEEDPIRTVRGVGYGMKSLGTTQN